jgi:hypothetical protein
MSYENGFNAGSLRDPFCNLDLFQDLAADSPLNSSKEEEIDSPVPQESTVHLSLLPLNSKRLFSEHLVLNSAEEINKPSFTQQKPTDSTDSQSNSDQKASEKSL